MNIKFGDRIRGADGTFRKVTALNGDTVHFLAGVFGMEGVASRAEMEAWAADPTPGKPKPADYDGQVKEMTIISISIEEPAT